MERRIFLKNAIAGTAVATAVGAGLLMPRVALADTAKFREKSEGLVSTAPGLPEGNFKFKAPKIAENGAVVPMTIDAAKIAGVTNISIFIRNNATPLAASFDLTGAAGFISTRVKMGKTSPVDALVTAAGQTTRVTKEVKVTIGGCGG